LGEQHTRDPKNQEKLTFFLDECLPYQIGDMLKQVGYPIVSWRDEFHEQGIKDPFIIPYLGAKHYVWITKDESARKEHEQAIRVSAISVVWVSGLDRSTNKAKRNYITVKDLHRMLTDKLDDLETLISGSNKPQYFILGMRIDGIPRLTKTTLDDFFKET
jgi:predicted nuclease of predicted toxin-antitoxin system